MTAENPRVRLGVLAIVVASLFCALLARMWYLQVLSADEFQLAAQENAIRTIVEPAARGRVLDRNGVVLIDNRPSNVVAVDRSQLGSDERVEVLARLSPLLGLPVATLSERLDDQTVSPITPVVVAEDVPDEVLLRIREQRDDLPGVAGGREAVRTFPQGTLAAHLLGYVGEISQERLAELEEEGNTRYRAGDIVGKAGVELAFDEELRGVDGVVSVEVDSGSRPVRVVDVTPPTVGADVVLAIDAEVQRVTEDALAQGLVSARTRLFEDDGTRFVADAGSAVVLDAQEGTVTALASHPSFDPAIFTDGLTEAEYASLSDEGAGIPQLNRAIQGVYAPGSTWKLVTATAALRNGIITPDSVVDDRGTYEIPDCRGAGCTKRNAGGAQYGIVDLRRALAVSSDVYFYTLGSDFWARRNELGKTAIQDVAVELGFGEGSGVDIPGERHGTVPVPAADLEDANPADRAPTDWFAGTNVNLAIGQGALAVTPIEIANAYATFANGGTRFEPNLALRVQRPDGSLVRQVAPRVASVKEIEPGIRATVLAGLEDSLVVDKGTGVIAFAGFPLDQYPVAGKTGTAQAPPRQDTALFAAVGPADAPRHAVAVVMEQAGFGSTSAAPVARAIFGQLSGLEQPGAVEVVEGVGAGVQD